MKINRLAIIYSVIFFIIIPNYLTAQTATDNNNQINLKVLEERIKQIEDKTNNQSDPIEKIIDIQYNNLKEEIALRFEELKERMNLILWILGIFLAFITFLGYKTIVKWIKQTIEEKTDVVVREYLEKADIEGNILQKGEESVNKSLLELETKAKERLEKIDKLRIDYEDSLSSLNKIKEIDITKPLPEESKDDLVEFGDKLKQLKEEREYSFNDLFYKGLSEYNKLNYETAIKYWLNASKLRPRDAAIYNNIGIVFSKLKKYEESFKNYNKAIELNPKYAIAYNNRGALYADLKDYKKSLEDYNKAIEFNPKYADAYNNRGNLYAYLKEYKKALEDYNKAIEFNPEDADIYNNRGVLYARLKDYKKALENYNKAIELNPKYAGAYNNRGNLYARLKDYKKALEDYNKAIELNPKKVEYYENISEFNIFTGDYKNALNYVNKAITLSSEMKYKAICFYLKSIIEKLLDVGTTESEKEFNKILENEFTITWNFDQIDNWLKEADIPEDKKRFIIEKTEILKKRKSKE